MLYQICDGSVSLGGNEILSHIDFEIKDKEKIAVVGKNGVGKSTLLKLILGELDLDRDDKRMGPGIRTSRKLRVAMLWQNCDLDLNKTVLELMLELCPTEDKYSKERFVYEMEYDRLFTGFGFSKEDKGKYLREFSGGEQTKISLIRLLLEKPDILLLDEPTNHLDISTCQWLERYMRGYESAVVFVSHDRFFLDQVVDTVYELENHKIKKYAGNYSFYRKQKRIDYEAYCKAYDKQQQEIKRLEGLIEQFKNKPKKAAFARSRKTILDRMDKLSPPSEDIGHSFIKPIEPAVLGSKWVFESKDLKVGYDKSLFELTMRLKRGQKIGIIGDNGVGKSTLIKTIAGLIEPIEGEYSIGNNVLMGYFDQKTADIESQKSVVEHFKELFPGMIEKEVRQTLGNYLFSGKEVNKRVSDLSGGEKSRLFLCELLKSAPNFLILDEPTNHMDINAKENLESAFKAYTGTLMFVSHDRYFVSEVADSLLIIEDGRVLYHPFGYKHYIEHKEKYGEDMAAVIQAENQAMIAGLMAVPKPERHRLKEISTESAYIDWKLKLAKEPLKNAEEEFAKAYNEFVVVEEQRLMSLLSGEPAPTEWNTAKEEMEKSWDLWTEECLAFYDVFLEEIE